MQVESYEGAVRYLESFIGKVVFNVDPESIRLHPPLDRMKMLLSILGNPQDKFKSVLVGGTSGKGSTAYLICHILTTSGYKTGLTVSPHLQKINERMQINGKQISDKEFTKMVSSMVQIIELMKKMEVGAPSYFEILIAMAFLYFAQNKVDIVVVEVGMGGEYDATNTLYPLIAVLTNVSLDHTNVLGGTVQKIAKTKAGIIKKYQISNIKYQINTNKENLKKPIVISGVTQPSVIKIVEHKCKEVGAKLYRLGKDFDFKIKKESLEGTAFDLIIFSGRRKRLNDLGVSLLGRYQVENASLAIETILQLRKFGFKVRKDDIRKALKTAFFPGRFEIVRFKGSPRPLNDSSELSGNTQVVNENSSTSTAALRSIHDYKETMKSPFRGEARPQDYGYTLILDGAHNPTKMKAFLTTLKKLYPKQNKIFIVGFKFDKDVKKMLKQILEVADGIIITEFRANTDISNNASADALNIKYLVQRTIGLWPKISKIKNSKVKKVVVAKNSRTAMKKVFQISKTQKGSLIVVTGSLYLVGEVRNML